MLHKWVEKSGAAAATGNVLERALNNIGRQDIIDKCIHNVEHVTDDSEKLTAKAQLAGCCSSSSVNSLKFVAKRLNRVRVSRVIGVRLGLYARHSGTDVAR